MHLWKTEEGIRSPVAGVTGSWELPDVDAWNQKRQQLLITAEPSLKFQADFLYMCSLFYLKGKLICSVKRYFISTEPKI